MAKTGSHRLTADEERRVREAENRLNVLRQEAEQARTDGRLAEWIRDTPGVRPQVDSVSDVSPTGSAVVSGHWVVNAADA